MRYPFHMDILSFLFPHTRCPVCSADLFGGHVLCEDCNRKLERLHKPFEIRGMDVRGHVVYHYEDPAKQLILAFKYHDARYLGTFLAGKMVETASRVSIGFDAVVPVPSHRSRTWFRGYNQSDILAQEIGRQMGLAVDQSCLSRVLKTPPLKALDRLERQQTLEGAFCAASRVPPRILLVDDIYTSGATVDACGHALYAGGAHEVVFVAFTGKD